MNDPDREGGCYAGHCDWRLPTSGGDGATGERPELESIQKYVFCARFTTCIDPLLGPTSDDYHWTDTNGHSNSQAWALSFGTGSPRIYAFPKFFGRAARAVRDYR